MPETIGLFILEAAAVAFELTIPADLMIPIALGIGNAVIAGASIGVSIGLSYALRPNAPKPADGTITTRQLTPPRIWVYGRARIGGYYMLYEEYSRNSIDVIALCDGPVCGFVQYFLNDDVVALDGTGHVSGAVELPGDPRYITPNAKIILIETRLGVAAETRYADVTALLPIGTWPATATGNGIASAALICFAVSETDFQKAYPHGKPELTVVVDGPALWDFRDVTQDPDDPTTWVPASVYDAGHTYAAGDRVSYGGAPYYARAGSNTGHTPSLGMAKLTVNPQVIPGSPYQIGVSNADLIAFDSDIGVVDAVTGDFFTRVASSPAAGQYTAAPGGLGGTYTFAAADAGRFVSISYAYVSSKPTYFKINSAWWVAVLSNPVLQLVDHLTDPNHGRGLDRDILITPALAGLIAEANKCDAAQARADGTIEPLYKSDGFFTFDTDPAEVANKILATCDGWMDVSTGVLQLTVGVYTAPTRTLSPQHIGPFSVSDNGGIPDEARVNELTISFTDPSQKYKEVPGLAWRDEDDISERGKTRSQTLSLTWVQSHAQARRLAKRAMARLAADKRGRLTASLYGMSVLGNRWFNIEYPDIAGLADFVVENQIGRTDFKTRRVDIEWLSINPNSIDAWDPATEEAPSLLAPIIVNPGVIPPALDFSRQENSFYLGVI